MSIGKLGEFNLASGSWNTYIERMEQYFLVNEVKVNLQVPTLLACVGDETYELMVDLCDPVKPSTLEYTKLVELVRKHVQPTPSVLAERYKFRKRMQGVNETVAAYAAALKHLARTCDFKSNLQENLRDQFVCGLYSETVRQRLFCESDVVLSYTVAYNTAIALESATHDAAAVVEQRNAEYAVHAVHASYSARGRAALTARPRRPGQRGGGFRAAPRSRSCYGCGSSDHTYNSCKFKEYVCKICLKPGHLKRVCPSVHSNTGVKDLFRLDATFEDGKGTLRGREPGEFDGSGESDGDGEGAGPSGLYMMDAGGSAPVVAELAVAGRPLRMHVDTGSPIACISDRLYRESFNGFQLVNDDLKLKGYDGQVITSLGYISVPVIFGNITKQLKLYVICKGGVPLLGRQWLKELCMDVVVENSLLSVRNVEKTEVAGTKCVQDSDTAGVPDEPDDKKRRAQMQGLVEQFPTVFSGQLGQLRSERATLRVREDAVPVYRRARPLPLALRPLVDAELRRMEDKGIISPIPSSDWASCLVVVLKSNGALRICGDYKSTVNPVLEVDRYPLPRAEALFNNLSGGKRYSKLDLSEAYSQVLLDDSKKYTVVNTHRGLYVYNRLVYGLASAPSIFQRIMERITAGIPNVSNFLDDILITGYSEEEHWSNLKTVFKRLADEGLTIRKEKCTFFAKEVSYLGFIISEQGVKTDPKKVKAVLEAPQPTNVTELKAFLGMANFYSKFIKDFAGMLTPLYDLTKKHVPWQWTAEQEGAIKKIKACLASCPVLTHYDETLPLILTSDASARGVAAVIEHRTARGEQPVAYASRTLTPAEINYSQIQREALAIVFGVKKFHAYLYGRKFTLRTDHQPLVAILGPKKDLPQTAAGRLIRWAILLSGYTYDIEYVRSEANNADALSRLPLLEPDENRPNDDCAFIHFVENHFPVNAKDINVESSKDKLISKVIGFVKSGWPISGVAGVGASGDDQAELTACWRRRDELFVEGGCLMWGSRVVVPRTLRARMLEEVHAAHLGIVKCKGLARSFVWWPGLDADVERVCAACRTCAETADVPPRSTVMPWSWPTRPFERVHIDFFSFNALTYLILVDAHSKWLEVIHMSNTTALNTINKIKEIFARFGVPRKLVSDNGPPFLSDEFKSFLNKNGIKHVTSAPYHPASNGEAENAVRTVKRAFKKANFEKVTLSSFLQRFLLDYRNCAHSTTGESPAMLVLGRQIRSRLDLVRDGILETVTDCLQSRAVKKGGIDRHWEVGDKLWARDYRRDGKWTKAVVINNKGLKMYEVQTEDGCNWSRHADQLRRWTAEPAAGEALLDAALPLATAAPAAALATAATRPDETHCDSSMGKVRVPAVVGTETDTGLVNNNQVPAASKRIRKPVVRYGFDD